MVKKLSIVAFAAISCFGIAQSRNADRQGRSVAGRAAPASVDQSAASARNNLQMTSRANEATAGMHFNEDGTLSPGADEQSALLAKQSADRQEAIAKRNAERQSISSVTARFAKKTARPAERKPAASVNNTTESAERKILMNKQAEQNRVNAMQNSNSSH